MIERDFVMRQVAELARVLAAVLTRRRTDGLDAAQEALADGLAQALGLGLDAIRSMGRPEVEALADEGGVVSPDKAVALADVLREDDDPAGRARARWLYELALRAGGPVPFDVHERIEALPTG